MNKDDAFRIVSSEDEGFGVEFSEEFLDSSVEEQMEQLKALLREKMDLPASDQDLSTTMAENEITIILIETFLAKLRRGERIQENTQIDLDFDALEKPFNVWD
jgi:hypothetical protein